VCIFLVPLSLYEIHRGGLFPPFQSVFVDLDRRNWGAYSPGQITLGLDREAEDKTLTLYPVSNVPAVQQIWVHPLSFWSRMDARLRDAEHQFAQAGLAEDLTGFCLDIDGAGYIEKDERGHPVTREMFQSVDSPLGISSAVRLLRSLDTICVMGAFSDGPCRYCAMLASSIGRLESMSPRAGKSKLHAEFWQHIKIMKLQVEVWHVYAHTHCRCN
jgi:hypothetical protein